MSAVQGLWVGGDLSLLEILSIRSFLANGHEYHLYTYGDVHNVPAGVTVKDASRIIGAEQVKRDKFGSFAFFADKFRYKLLLEEGGWWVDSDVVCLKNFDAFGDYCFGIERPGRVNNAVIKAPPDSPLIKALAAQADQFDEHVQWGGDWARADHRRPEAG